MCCEDLKIGRKTQCRQVTVTIPTAAGEIVKKDSRRIAIVFGSNAGTPYLWGVEKELTTSIGVRVPADSEPQRYLLSEHGDMVRGPIFGVADGAAFPITFVETLDVTNVCENQ